ncbi:mercuric reductase [Dyadobacter psychrotolerans]|uniref:Mercuric reductase n=1 Tax=Dyadobacter psychrotolerans TaxID=2541721 RepID=A0A4R5DSP5_9BACT|nr:mercuric reductase [Dyadobacter psychrotolerans]TDE15374.1 mercuric reductase [Dyadobacter psychrotolerans]
MKKYDAIVIGAGQAGRPLSKKLAESGLNTLLIEKRWVGGTCVNDGCSPTKAMIASAKAAWTAANSKKLGLTVTEFKVDLKTILKRKDDIVHMMRKNSEEGIEETENLDLIYGTATFSGEKQITVSLNDGGQEEFKAEMIFINTGAKPSVPDIEGLSEINYLDSTSILDIQEIPEHLLIVGGGYIGLEFGQMFKRLGSKVTIIIPSDRLIPKEDEDISQEMEKIFELEEIEIYTKTKVTSFKQSAKAIVASIDVDGNARTLKFSHVLIATGRIPQTADLKLELTDVETDEEGHIKVNEFLETSSKGIYALGDVKGGPAFTHISFDDYRVIRTNLLENGQASIKNRLVPYCMFTDPQLGRIGITEQDAIEKGLDILIPSMPNSSVARSIETGDERGMIKAVVDAKTGKILGASVLAEQGGEIVSILQMAMMGGITYEQIMESVFAHPTYAESLNNLFMTIEK